MTKTRIAAVVGLALTVGGSAFAQNDDASQDDGALTTNDLAGILAAKTRLVQTLGYHPKLVRAVVEQNNKGLSQSSIDERDAQWRTSDINLFRSSLLNNSASSILRDLVESNEFFTEAFLTDGQGANVATFPSTSDYWQGDEEKWSESFNDGSGQVYLGPLELDESTGLQQVQISAPVFDVDNNQTIGVLVVGVAVNAMTVAQ